MHSGAVRIVVAIVLIVALSLGTVRNAVVLVDLVTADGFGAFALGTAVGALVPLLALIGAILLLRSGIVRRRASRAAASQPEPADTGTADRFELAREYPEDRWTSLPLNEERVAHWLVTRAFTEGDGSQITVDTLRRSDETERTGSRRTLVHRYDYVAVTLLTSFSRLRALDVELLVADSAIRSAIIADLRTLADELGGLALRAVEPAAASEPLGTTA